jgi:excisionase family DNA binding protein
METINEQRFDRKQAAKYLGVSVITLDRALADKKLSCFRIGRRVLFSKEHLDNFLSSCEQKAKQKRW